ncbi:ABC transporter ATP-binding protein [Pseudolabrys sp. Root1462]|uniref:ABC transporter ATP-binding protein n=1 Tax=Pseudolabrys sp. Root1462 TaxID=1736466 RepID=UPI0007029003|nr:ABC transporter ATP-binding protein [Pseudolabrys sp. Root1462]KQY98200.1 ABC transporter ATP-binding protein [Pseudolabrys sp. Root1462]
MSSPLLEVSHLAKRFGGIVATDDVSFAIPQGELHALIGPNGAGKTTLIAQLSGSLFADSGAIQFAGADITRLPMQKRSHIGLARSFQITSLFLDLSVLDNVALAVQAHAGHSFSFWRPARSDAALREPALAALARVGLIDRADRLTAALSHGEHRLLELAMALAGKPRLLLLDEPMAGLGPEESARMVGMLRALKRDFTILLVEHDMEAVFALADRISVLVYGRIIASGSPDDIRANGQVREAYLGDAEVAHA